MPRNTSCLQIIVVVRKSLFSDISKNWLFFSLSKHKTKCQNFTVICLLASKQLQKLNSALHPGFFKHVSAQVPIRPLAYKQITLQKPAISPILKWIQGFQEQTKELSYCLVRNFRKTWYFWYVWSLIPAPEFLFEQLSWTNYCCLSRAL